MISDTDVNMRHWENFRVGCYKHNFTFTMSDGNSFWLGIGLNLKKTAQGRVRIDFNPNKVANCVALKNLICELMLSSHETNRNVTRYDLAIDIPEDRFDCFLVKDNRAYIERRHGQEWTQYLGSKASHLGRVKLYNKQVEAKLDYPLTRLELTLSPETQYGDLPLPKVYYINSRQVTFEDLRITDTERFVLNAILQGCGSTRDLGRKTRAKIESVMENYITTVRISEDDYSKILNRVEAFKTNGII